MASNRYKETIQKMGDMLNGINKKKHTMKEKSK